MDHGWLAWHLSSLIEVKTAVVDSIQHYKMLYVFQMDVGQMLTFEISLLMDT